MGGGVSMAIATKAGVALQEHARRLKPVEMGEVVVTTGGSLRAKYVLHAVTIGARAYELPDGAIVRRATQRALRLLPQLGCTSIAFPAIGAGAAQLSYDVVAAEMAGVLINALLSTPLAYSVELYLMDRFQRKSPQELLELFTANLAIDVDHTPAGFTLSEPKDPRGTGRRPAIFEMLRHLDTRRDHLETRLIDLLRKDDSHDSGEWNRLKERLAHVRELRQIYERELSPLSLQTGVVKDSVFVSSTFVDLERHRRELRGVIENLNLRYLGMEGFVPAGQAPGEYIRRRVDEGEVYFAVIGMRYGSIDPDSGFSMTELEYRQAVASGKERLIFVMDDRAPITVDMVERNPEGFAKLHNFRHRILQGNVCGMFMDVEDLKTKAAECLSQRGH